MSAYVRYVLYDVFRDTHPREGVEHVLYVYAGCPSAAYVLHAYVLSLIHI